MRGNKRPLVVLSAASLVVSAFGRLTAQGQPHGYHASQLQGASFVEQVHSDVTTQTGIAQRHRIVVRTANYSVATHKDTLVVTADSFDLSETADGVRRAIDVDAVIGGRWLLTVDAGGHISVADQPFVPRDIADVSDLGRAMDDFFPPAPPSIAFGRDTVDAAHWQWHRLSDSAGLRRYHWSGQRHNNTTSSMGDSVVVKSIENAFEKNDLAWDAMRGPIAWTRSIQTDVTSRFAGRTVRAVVDQHIEVRRIP